jgi:hypothetical protein
MVPQFVAQRLFPKYGFFEKKEISSLEFDIHE